MLVDASPVAAVVLVEGNAVDRLVQQLCEGRFSFLYRRPPQVVAVELEQVEGAEDHVVTPPVSQQIEHCKPVGIADDRLTVDQTGPHRQLTDRRRRQREALGKIIPVAAVEPHAAVVSLGHDAVAVVLDVVNPTGPRRRPRGRAGQARFYASQLTL